MLQNLISSNHHGRQGLIFLCYLWEKGCSEGLFNLQKFQQNRQEWGFEYRPIFELIYQPHLVQKSLKSQVSFQLQQQSPLPGLSFFKKVCIYFQLHWVFIAVCGLSLVAVSEGYFLVAVRGLLIAMTSLAVEHGFWSPQASVVMATVSLKFRLVSLKQVESSQTRDQTGVLCIARWILNHRTTRETPP